jgi:peptide-methionine (S)-S-oxide reductase
VDGVLEVISGYMGGTVKNPSYEEVSAGKTGHAESVEVRYDPTKVTYIQLLEAFWRNVDPITPDAQFCDHGNQYFVTMGINTGPRFFIKVTQKNAQQKSRNRRLNVPSGFHLRSSHS